MDVRINHVLCLLKWRNGAMAAVLDASCESHEMKSGSEKILTQNKIYD
jgi:hypothetical protein